MKRYVTAISILIVTIIFANLQYYMRHPLTIFLGGGKELQDMFIEAGILVFVTSVITLIYIKIIGFGEIRGFIAAMWGAVILFTMLNVGPSVAEEVSNARYRSMMEQAYKYHRENLKQGYSFEKIMDLGDKDAYIFQRNGDLTKEDMDYLIDYVQPIDEHEIIIVLANENQKKQATMTFNKNKEFITCDSPGYVVEFSNICFGNDGGGE